MGSFKSQGAQKPTALGSLLQAATYGATIPKIYGMTQSPLLAIWAANLRQGGSTKKFKQFKKGITSYVENIDFLLGHNPIRGMMQAMVNGTIYPLDFKSVRGVFMGGGAGYEITDPKFYAVVAVTFSNGYSFTFDDYGSQGAVTESGTWEIPLWNSLEQEPDPTLSSYLRNFPFCYRWAPGYGPYVYVDPQFTSAEFNIYYAALSTGLDNQAPTAKLRFFFENELGNGPEYADAPAPFNAQQIIYPHFAGLGSSDIDLGATGALPQINPEIAGKWGIYPTGDADFCDMIEDVLKSGLAQAALGASSTPYTQMESGLSSYNLPGCVQAKFINSIYPTLSLLADRPTVAGNFLVVFGCADAPLATLSISDTGGHTWIPIFAAGLSIQAWYCKETVGALTTITVGNANQFSFFEIAGVDTLDTYTAVSATGNASITTGNAQGFADYLLCLAGWRGAVHPSSAGYSQWLALMPPASNLLGLYGGAGASTLQVVLQKTVYSPSDVSIANVTSNGGSGGGSVPDQMCLLSFKATTPATYPMPLGDFLDADSLELTRAQCRANGLWGSLTMTAQSAASDWLKSLFQAANAAPVFLGSKLYVLPYSEVSAAGNGAYYTAPTSPGPIANLSDLNGDFVGSDGCPARTTVDRIGQPNVLQLQIISREANYNQLVVSQPEASSIALYGVRKADPVVNNAIQDATIARMILGIMVRRAQFGGDAWAFNLGAKWCLLSPMDLVTLTDTIQAIAGVPVRLTSLAEQDDGSFECAAEPFIYGMSSPTPYETTSPAQNLPVTGESAGDVNPPIIFEPTKELFPGYTGDEIWLAVSSGAANYGGCAVFVSTDGGASYVPAPSVGGPGENVVMGNSVTGALTAAWPAATDPDTTNNLLVNTAESNGVIESLSAANRDNFEYPCYVQETNLTLSVNGAPVATGNPLGIAVNGTAVAAIGTLEVNTTAVAATGSDGFGYELMSYAATTLTGPNQYTLLATGAGNELRRAILNAPNSSGAGVVHPIGSRFAVLNPSGSGIFKMNMPALYVGKTIYFKILSFNSFGAALQSLSDVPAYSYVPTGAPGAV